jgi:hypothetical protein
MNFFIKFSQLKLKSRLLTSFLIFCLIPLFILSIYASINLRENIYSEKKDSLKKAVGIAVSLVNDYYQKISGRNLQ